MSATVMSAGTGSFECTGHGDERGPHEEAEAVRARMVVCLGFLETEVWSRDRIGILSRASHHPHASAPRQWRVAHFNRDGPAANV